MRRDMLVWLYGLPRDHFLAGTAIGGALDDGCRLNLHGVLVGAVHILLIKCDGPTAVLSMGYRRHASPDLATGQTLCIADDVCAKRA